MRLLIIFTLIVMVNFASADVGYFINKGQPPRPAGDEGEPDIRMAAEAVDIILHPGGVDVDGVFEFVNDSDEPREVGMFFPLNVGTLELTDKAREKLEKDEFYGFGLGLEGKDVTARFGLEIDGEAVSYEVTGIYYDTDGSTEELTGNAVWTAGFAPGERKTVTVSYYCDYGTEGMVFGCREFYYVLYTGAPWKGPIGEGRITIKPGDDFDWAQPILPRTMDMPPLSVYDDRLEWTFKDFEPSAPDTEKGVKYGIWNGSAIEIVVPRSGVVADDTKIVGVARGKRVYIYENHPDDIGDRKNRQIGEISPINEFTIFERRGSWYRVYYGKAMGGDGLSGWIRWVKNEEETNEQVFNVVKIKSY